MSSKKDKNGYFVPRVMRDWRNAGERMTSRGWRGDSERHALASKGIRTVTRGEVLYMDNPIEKNWDNAVDEINNIISDIHVKDMLDNNPEMAMKLLKRIDKTLVYHGVYEGSELYNKLEQVMAHLSNRINGDTTKDNYGYWHPEKKFGAFSWMWEEYTAPAPIYFKDDIDDIIIDIKGEPGHKGKVLVKKMDRPNYKTVYGEYEWYKIGNTEYLIGIEDKL